MKNKLQFLIFFSFILSFSHLFAKKKYALIIGINQYYDRPGLKYSTRLQGCVNDANTMKALLHNRFNFDQNDITVLTDEHATSKNVVTAFNQILQKVKAGDVFVFYFSGHGVWINNMNQNKYEARLKKNMNQAIVLADLYADKLGCLYKDSDIKRQFNKFIDKKVITTGIFDCCFSGHLSMMETLSMHNPYQNLNPTYAQRSISFRDVLQSHEQYNDALMTHAEQDRDSVLLNMLETGTKAFNLSDPLNIPDSVRIPRPAERPNSMFLSISGTDEYQKGEEMKDANGIHHGVFTKALLQAIDELPVNVAFSVLFNRITQIVLMNGFKQTPLHFEDAARLRLNLVGFNSPDNRNNPIAHIISNQKQYCTMDAGTNSDIAPGNTFTSAKNKQIKLKVVSVTDENAQATITSGKSSQVNKGDQFIRTGNFVASEPLIKLYVELSPIPQATFKKILNEKMIPLSNLATYRDYKNWFITEKLQYLSLSRPDLDAVVTNHLNGFDNDPFMVFLPLPQYIFSDFKSKLQQNQNYKLVQKSSEADLILYLNYTKEEGGNFVMTWYTDVMKLNGFAPQFYTYNISSKHLPDNPKEISKLTTQLSDMTSELVQKYTGIWLNHHPRQ